MKEKIKLALVNKYKSLGYSQKAINAVLDYLEKSVKEETEIDDAVDGVGPVLKAFQSEIDVRIAAAEKAKKEKEEEDEKEEASKKEKSGGVESETTKKTTKKDSDEVPDWAKALVEGQKAQAEANKLLSDKLAAIESGKTVESRKSTLSEKLKDAPEAFKTQVLKGFNRMVFNTDDEFNEYLAEVETDKAEFTQSLSDSGLSLSGKPLTPSGGGSTSKQATKEELDAVMVNL